MFIDNLARFRDNAPTGDVCQVAAQKLQQGAGNVNSQGKEC
jgi:hypothetical protein